MKGAKIALVVICFLVAAGIAFFTWGGETEVADPGEAKTNWKCEACGDLFQLTDSELSDAYKESGGSMPILCPKCKELKGWPVALCPTCNEWYWSAGKPGELGTCPNCTPKQENIDLGPVDSGPEQPRKIIKSY